MPPKMNSPPQVILMSIVQEEEISQGGLRFDSAVKSACGVGSIISLGTKVLTKPTLAALQSQQL